MRFLITFTLLGIIASGSAHAEVYKNHFASVLVGSKKIGQVHFTTTHTDEGLLQELKTRTSYSILGRELYHHALDVVEFWTEETLQSLEASSNDNGDTYEASLTRDAGGYSGELNGGEIQLPLDAFPVAVWHYAITKHRLLFNIPDFRLLKVKVAKSADTVKIGGRRIPAEKFVFSGDWEATVWFDHDQQFLKWAYKVLHLTVVVVLDP